MKTKPSKFLEDHRVRIGELASDVSYGMNGAFQMPLGSVLLFVVASDGRAWDHVSVHAIAEQGERCPTWEEMDYIRKLMFRGDEWVMQLHAPIAKHINCHPFTLHMWRPQGRQIPIPPVEAV